MFSFRSASAVRSRSNGIGWSENRRSRCASARWRGGARLVRARQPAPAGGAAAGIWSTAACSASRSMRFDFSAAVSAVRVPRPIATSPARSPSALVRLRPCSAAPLRKPPAASVSVPWKAICLQRRQRTTRQRRQCRQVRNLAPPRRCWRRSWPGRSAMLPLAETVAPAAWSGHVDRKRQPAWRRASAAPAGRSCAASVSGASPSLPAASAFIGWSDARRGDVQLVQRQAGTWAPRSEAPTCSVSAENSGSLPPVSATLAAKLTSCSGGGTKPCSSGARAAASGTVPLTARS